ncbi:MraY family glycosyltransferase [Pelagibius marinus]|uniref:MraY family glycosyltransferase n=1 Tax=Pelagibius marinus TaxID=2762760 RepID=UPI0018733986|nr:glycosyltransferase family 4 protein [Pelagibius marinus]
MFTEQTSHFAAGLQWLILATLLTALASWAASGAVLRLLLRWRIFDEPNHRSSHDRPKPRGGGLAVVPVALAAWIVAGLATETAGVAFWHAVAGAVVLAAVSWADDLKSQPASLRFGIQVAAVVFGLWALAPDQLVFQGLLPLPADRLLTALAWLWFVNLFNFMDGIDGIAAVETASIGGGLAAVALLLMLPAPEAFLGAALAAAALGFLYWNWAPSRIFLGDVGSVPLGYLLGWLLILAAAAGQWSVALILPLYYLADATWTLGRRALRREKIWRAHREHFYQRAVQRGFSHAAVAARILLCNALLVVLALYAAGSTNPAAPWIALGLALLAVIFLLFMLARQRPPAPRA